MKALQSLSRHRDVLLLVAVALLAWSNAFEGAFVYDDANILNDPRLENPSAFAAHAGTMIRHATNLTFLADRMLWGEAPAGFHLVNVLLHLGSALLVYAVVARLAAGRRGVAFWTAMLFVAHPIATETVTYVSGRATGLMTFAYLAALHLYLRGRHGLALAAFGVALLSKETAATFPLALLWVDFIARGYRGPPHARLRGGPPLRAAFLRGHLPFWGLLAAFLALAAFHPRYGHLLDTSLAIRPVFENLVAQVNVVAYALTLFVLPDRLSLVHDLPLVTSLFTWPTALSLLAILSLPAAAILARRDTLAAFGILWFFLQILPTQSVLPRLEPLSERNLYLASMGLFLAAASLACHWIEQLEGPKRLLAGAAPAVVVAVLVAATLSRNALYADPVAFWTQAVARAPGSANAHVNLGHAHYLAGDLDKSIAEFRRALALERDNPVAQSNLAAAWRMRAR